MEKATESMRGGGQHFEHLLWAPSVLWHYWLGGRKGIRPVKNGGWWRWALLSTDGVAPSQLVSVSDSVNLPLHHKVQKFCSSTGSPRWSWKKGRKTAVVVMTPNDILLSFILPAYCSWHYATLFFSNALLLFLQPARDSCIVVNVIAKCVFMQL